VVCQAATHFTQQGKPCRTLTPGGPEEIITHDSETETHCECRDPRLLCGGFWEYSLMDWIFAGIIVAIAMALAAQRSSFLVDYVVIVYVFNRGLRRVLDYYSGAFNPFSPVSLTPLLVAGLMLIVFLQRFGTLPKVHKTIFYCLFTAIGYSFIIGFFRIQLAAVFALGEVLAPIAVFGYIVTLSQTSAMKDRWLRTSAWCAVGAAAYGWYQYLTIPPWDAFWVRAVGFEGYLGTLEPTKMTVFSTMAERGPLGGYLGFAVVPMILAAKWRPLSWFGVVLVLSVILLAGTRTGVILVAFSTMVYVMVNRGTGFWQLALGGVVIFAAAYFGMGAMPGGEQVEKRFSTLSNMQEDGSYQGRVEIYQDSVSAILSNPLGAGMGASGISGRINVGGTGTQSVIADAGYAEIFIQFGWLGAPLIFYALWLMWKDMATRYRIGMKTTDVMLARAFMLALIPACFVGNIITQFSILWIAFGAALDPRAFRIFVAKLQMAREARSRSRMRPAVSPG
jgi:putative inorganic carbon (HCO3(-)) transporter